MHKFISRRNLRDFFMFPELETSRLLLQQIKPEDQQFIFEGMSHPEVIPFYGVTYDTFEATGVQMEWYRKMVDEGWGLPWKIVDRQTGEKMGVVSVYYYKPEHKKAEIGYWLLPQYWKKGIATEAMKAAIHYWQTEKGLHRMEAFVEDGNEGSCKMLQKAGFQYEGKMKDCEIKNGKYISLLIYALILE